MDFRILGPLDVRAPDGTVRKLSRRKPRLLLAILLLNANQRLTAAQLIDCLWGEQPPASAQQNLHSYASELRRLLNDGKADDGPRLRVENGHYTLRVEPGELDAESFEEMVSRGVRAGQEEQPAIAVERLVRALGLWRSHSVADGLDLPDLARGEAARLEQLRVVAIEAAFEARIELGSHLDVVPELEDATRAHPLRERLWALRMLALYRSGLRAEAMACYEQVRRLLSAELGVEPGSDVRRMRDQILVADPALDPVRSVVRPVPAAQLPGDTAAFTGRRGELEQLAQVAGEQEAHPTAVTVITIDGMAGVGKTALAVHTAHRLAPSYPDGQLYLDLHGFSAVSAPIDPSDALEHLLRSVGVPSEQIPSGLDGRAALWRTQVGGLRLLIVLDNAAGEEQVKPLIPGSAGCLTLVTSRLRLAGLDVSTSISLDVLPQPDASELFTRVVGADRIGDEPAELVAEVAALCGQLPLALRIAGARLASRPAWPLDYVAKRLRNEQRRVSELRAGERSVAAAIRLSYRQLTADQQRMFRVLGEHPGLDIEPFAAAALAGTTSEHAERLLDDLLDANLVHQYHVGRYQFHDLVRAFATETVIEQTPAAQRRSAMNRLLAYYAYTTTVAADLLYPNEAHGRQRPEPSETPAPELREPNAAAVWLDAELDNLVAAAKTPPADGDSSAHVLRIAAQLHWHLRTRARYADAEQVHAHALEVARHLDDRTAELDALTGLGHAYHGRGQHAAATECFEQALQIAREIGDRVGQLVVGALGHLHLVRGRLPEARKCFEEALAMAHELGDRIAEVGFLTGLGSLHRKEGRTDAALTCFEQAHAVARRVGDRTAELGALIGLGRVHQQLGRYGQAEAYFADALSVAREVGHLDGQLNALLGLGDLQLSLDRHEQAEAYFEQLLGPATEIGDRNYQLEALLGLGRVCLATARENEAVARFEQALRRASELEQAGDAARAHDGLALAYDRLGRSAEAREHWRAALASLTASGNAGAVTDLDVDGIRARLSELESAAALEQPAQ